MKFKKYYYLAVIFYLLAITFNITQGYLASKKAIIEQVDAKLLQSIQSANLLLPKNFHHKNMLQASLDPADDRENIEKLSEHANILGVKYIYTMIKDKDKIIFTSSSATPKELATNSDLSHFGDIYDDASPIVSEVFQSQQKAFDEYTDKWGQFHTLYIPFVSEDGTQFVVGADIDISGIDEKFNEKLFDSIEDIIFDILILMPFFLVYRRSTQQIKKELEETIEKRTHELQEQQRKMFQQSKMAAMGEMISNIAHQWRQPLSIISTCASGAKLQDEVGILTKDVLYSNMDNIVKNTEYLSKTIDNFRNFFSPDRPKETKKISEVFDTIDSIFGNSLAVANITVIKNIEDITLNTYVNELSQVVVNFIKNAKDAINKDGTIVIDCFVDDMIYIKVKDSGGGIPDDVIDKIYEPYFTTKHESIGTGIGLNMSYQIVTEHLKGNISVENVSFVYNDKTMYGAEFTVSLSKDLLVKE